MVAAVNVLACDTHMHFYDAAYTSSPNATLFPPDATVDDYRVLQQQLGLDRVVVVQPTTYGVDNSCQLAAMASLGDCARGVMVVNAATDRAELARLTELGVVGARFHQLPGGAVPWEELAVVANAVVEFGWHIQLQCNGRELGDRYEELAALPTALVVDHVGRYMPPVSPRSENFAALRHLIDAGKTWVKLSAPYESSREMITNTPSSGGNHSDVLPLIDHLVTEYAERMLWASNWPHPGQDTAPSVATLQAQLDRWLPTPEVRDQVLVQNPGRLYFT